MADACLDLLLLGGRVASQEWHGPASAGTRRGLTGQSLVEYTLILLLIALAVFAAVSILGGQLQTVYSQIAASIQR